MTHYNHGTQNKNPKPEKRTSAKQSHTMKSCFIVSVHNHILQVVMPIAPRLPPSAAVTVGVPFCLRLLFPNFINVL